MKWYEIVIIALLIPVGYFLRELAYSSQRNPHRLHEAIANLRQNLRRWGSRKNHKEKRL